MTTVIGVTLVNFTDQGAGAQGATDEALELETVGYGSMRKLASQYGLNRIKDVLLYERHMDALIHLTSLADS